MTGRGWSNPRPVLGSGRPVDQGDGHQGSGRGAPNRSAVSSLPHRSPARALACSEASVRSMGRRTILSRRFTWPERVPRRARAACGNPSCGVRPSTSTDSTTSAPGQQNTPPSTRLDSAERDSPRQGVSDSAQSFTESFGPVCRGAFRHVRRRRFRSIPPKAPPGEPPLLRAQRPSGEFSTGSAISLVPPLGTAHALSMSPGPPAKR